MRLLVTGGLGFQGSHLADYWLSQGHTVTLLNTSSERAVRLAHETGLINRARVVWGSITDWEVVSKAVEGQDVVINLAAWANPDKTLEQPWGAVNVNVMGTLNVLNAVKKAEIPIIHGSSCEVYGSSWFFDHKPQDEHAPFHPNTPYAAGKAGADALVWSYAISYDVHAVILRPCNIYGPRQRSGPHGGVIPNFFEQARLGANVLTIRGSGNQTREFLYISDRVWAYNRILKAVNLGALKGGRIFNVGSGENVAVSEIAQMVAELVGKPYIKIEREASRKGDVSSFTMRSNEFREQFDFEPQVPFKTGLQKYWEWKQAYGR